ncbi:MAG TPA: ATP-binding protein [Candidatus Onthousia excrementipullorum]|uniref:ATP-binding protein n=1 Tax=Candidatus Onthousia excrementipullorum TaxID=2840884 RepID=A0A9D1J3E8_9FIRM|nr:ATP-binding protein [Candidatus Onthousia excrementipullorum]
MEKYKSRIADEILERKLKGKGAVLIEGPKWCGKTTTAEQISKSVLYMADPANQEQNLTLADINPALLLTGDTPRLIDEWQLAPKLWDAIRFEVDHRGEEGQFILTGSAVPVDRSKIAHTGTGRFSWLLMRPMTLYESGESTGTISLKDLFNSPSTVNGINNLSLEDIAYLCCRGGWPRSIFLDKDIALDSAFDYYDAIVNSDISRVDGVSRNPLRVKNLMRSYARNIGSQASIETIKNDMINNDSFALDTDTVFSYINALKKIFVIEESPAWNPNLRSKTAIRTSDTRYFIDPSIATASLGIGPEDLINDLNTFGLVFETLCVRDLRVYAESINGSVYHYRDSSSLECDAVIHLRNGSYGLVEIKLGGDKLIDEGTKNLIKMQNKIDTEKMKKPSFMMVLTATGNYAYKRDDDVYVIPVGCLKN